MNLFGIAAVLTKPDALFRELSEKRPSARRVFFSYVIWIGLIPPVCAYIGMITSGWHFGIGEPVSISPLVAAGVAIAYYACLFAGYALTTILMQWMAPTYNADTHSGLHAALAAIVGTPLMLGGFLHLYPLLPLNLLFLVPAMIWSVYLLYTGVPKMLGTDQARGVLMASSVLGILFVSAAALAMLTIILWVNGLGPDIGFDWRLSVEG